MKCSVRKYTCLQVLVFPQSQTSLKTTTYHRNIHTWWNGDKQETLNRLQKVLLESTLEMENVLLTSFCTSLGCMSNREADRCHSKQNVLLNIRDFLWEMCLWTLLTALASATLFTDL